MANHTTYAPRGGEFTLREINRKNPPFENLKFDPEALKQALREKDYFVDRDEQNNNIVYFDGPPAKNKPLSQVLEQFKQAA